MPLSPMDQPVVCHRQYFEHSYYFLSPSPSGGSALSPRAAAAMHAEIERQKMELMAKKGLAEDERDKAQKELERRERELTKAQ